MESMVNEMGKVGLGLLLATSAIGAMSGRSMAAPLGPDAAWWAAADPLRPATHETYAKTSRYVAMPDGVRLAVDVYLPQPSPPGARFPTIFVQTRYYRSVVTAKDGAAACKMADPSQAFFLRHGYAVVVADVRGTGASFGSRRGEFSQAERADALVLARWIAQQPWSTGRIGTFGSSYLGTTAELAVTAPEVRAAAVISAGYDFYADINFPGGVKNERFIAGWGAVNAGLDSAGAKAPLPPGGLGPCPVDEDPDGHLLAAAIAGHAANANIAEQLAGVAFRDDPAGPEGWPSPYRVRAAVNGAGKPIYGFAGWTDSAYGQAALNRFRNAPKDSQWLTVGAVTHGGKYFYGPGVETATLSAFDRNGEMLRFFDHYVAGRDNGFTRQPRVHYFMTGADAWRTAKSWPPVTRARALCLTGRGALDETCGTQPTGVLDGPRGDVAAGGQTRWDTTLGASPVVYPERSAADRAGLVFTSAALARPLEIAGEAALDLDVLADTADPVIFAVLEDVGPDGRAFYVSEGELRVSHARPGATPYRSAPPTHTDLRADGLGDLTGRTIAVALRLQPTAHRFAAGHAVRLTLFRSDTAHFGKAGADQAWRLRVGGRQPARLVLPSLAEAGQ